MIRIQRSSTCLIEASKKKNISVPVDSIIAIFHADDEENVQDKFNIIKTKDYLMVFLFELFCFS